MHRTGNKAWTSRRGMTLLEVILASVLLAGLASALVGTVVFAHRSEVQRVKRLMAYDVANRLLLQYIDDDRVKDMTPPNEPILHEGLNFYYELIEEPLRVQTLAGETPKLADKMRLIRVRVFDSYEVAPGNIRKTDQLAQLERPYHLLMALYRNEDAKRRALGKSSFLQEISQLAPNAASSVGGGR